MRELGKCIIDDCKKPACNSRGWCHGHYWRWRTHGDPLKGRTRENAPKEFLEGTVLPYSENNCLIWPYSKNNGGYGVISENGQMKVVSRLICERVNGPPPSPCHQAAHNCGCGSLGCVNPRHLEWKTPLENGSDRIIHGTSGKGQKSPRSKLSEGDIATIRKSRSAGAKLETLAKDFGVSPSLIGQICQRKIWTHIW